MVLAFQLMKQQGRLLMRIEALERSLTAGGAMVQTPEQPALPGGLPIGARAPGFTLPDLAGTSVSLDSLLTTRPLLLLFTDPHCGPCAALLPEVGRWQREYADRLAIAVISRGAPEQYRARAAEHGIVAVLFQSDYEVADLFQVNDTPGAVLVRLDGTIGSPVASGGEQIRALVAYVQSERAPEPWVNLPHIPVINTAGHDHSHPPALPPVPSMGEPAPPVILPGLDGQSVDLAEFRGSATLVLFWSPGCPFCLQVLPELQAWEAEPPVDAPRLLVVSAGTAEEHRALGLRAPIGLDPAFTIGPAFGADGTPSAVLIDAEGRIASGLAVGGPAVLALAGMAPGQRSTATA
jgi:thiol-disulfide isomerase/thioredoxin